MSIEMKHAERLQQSINALETEGKPYLEAGPCGCLTLLLALPALLFVILALATAYATFSRIAALL